MATTSGSDVQKGNFVEMQRPIGSTSSKDVEASDEFAADINGQKTGTSADAKDMHRLGKTQEMKRNFRSVSILGLSSLTMATWAAFLGSCNFSMLNGGLAGTVWIFLAVWLFTIPISLSLAEMASMAPTSGGQYHWTSEFAPPHLQKPLSYIVGWLSALGQQSGIAVTAFVSGSIILQMAQMGSGGSFVPTVWESTWQATVMMIAVVAFAVLFNTVGAKHLPLFEGAVLGLHVVGLFAVLIPLWILAPKNSAEQVFSEFSNFGGWPTTGGACLIGTLTATGSLGGIDASVHLAEEVKHASRVVPRMMVATILLNGFLGLIMAISYAFCVTDVEAFYVTSESAFPFIDVFYAGTGSTGGSIAMTAIIAILNVTANLSVMAAGSRQAWAFARDQGLPFSGWLSKVVTMGTPIPFNAILVSLVITIAISMLNLGSAAAFNTVMGLLASAGGLSYAVSIGCVLWRRLYGAPLPSAPFTLGRWGVPINILAIFFALFQMIISFFPATPEVTSEDMNYGVVMFGGVALISVVYYAFRGRHVYKGPVVNINYE